MSEGRKNRFLPGVLAGKLQQIDVYCPLMSHTSGTSWILTCAVRILHWLELVSVVENQERIGNKFWNSYYGFNVLTLSISYSSCMVNPFIQNLAPFITLCSVLVIMIFNDTYLSI